MNTAIIVAAGSGTRFNSQRPKQFLEVLGKPVIIHTIERFEDCPDVSEIILVLAEEEIAEFSESVKKYNFTKLRSIVAGGGSRAQSVLNGFAAVDPATNVVAVHDGARPLVTSSEIGVTIRRAAEDGAACLVAPVTDTIKEVDGDHIVGTVDRRVLRRALTPQAFRYAILHEAFENADNLATATDECFLVEELGYQIATIPGSARNIKITHAEDLLLAEAILNSLN